MKTDMIERSRLSFDEKYRLLKRATNGSMADNISLELRKARFTHMYHVICRSEGNCFYTRFFAERFFKKLCKEHHLKEIDI
jgi:hypothetical protein